MDFFSVWWYDLLLALAIVPQVVRFFLGGSKTLAGFLSWFSIALQLVSIVALPFIGCELEGALIVLMIFATVTSGLAFLESRLGEAKAKIETKEESES